MPMNEIKKAETKKGKAQKNKKLKKRKKKKWRIALLNSTTQPFDF
jgi:hypothetical protein